MAVRSPHSIPVHTEDITATIERLGTYVRRLEARYECSSEEMATLVRSGYTKGTAEISLWLQQYRVLEQLREAVGNEAGTPTTTTG